MIRRGDPLHVLRTVVAAAERFDVVNLVAWASTFAPPGGRAVVGRSKLPYLSGVSLRVDSDSKEYPSKRNSGLDHQAVPRARPR